jgi:hypothetical protein
MFLVAQRVVTPHGEGINAFYHAHGPRPDWVWEPPDGVPDRDPGEVQHQDIQVVGQGRVRSFLDIAAPDGTPVQQLQWAHQALVALAGVGAQFPVIVVSGPIFVRYDLESQLRDEWHAELHALLDAVLPLAPSGI